MTEKLGHIAGIDEAGRGPLAGPVVAAIVVLDPSAPVSGLNDSKKLSKRSRQLLNEAIHSHALFVAISVVDANIIDEINILQSTLLAMKNVIEQARSSIALERVLIDGCHVVPGISGLSQHAIVKGDSLVPEIMAASIVAKVHRDALMEQYHELYPSYGFNLHKGYGTKRHMEAIAAFGPTAIHRLSFAPLKGSS